MVPVLPFQARREAPLSRVTVLLADDHEDFLAVERRLLEPEFEVVLTVRDGWAAVEAAGRLASDLLPDLRDALAGRSFLSPCWPVARPTHARPKRSTCSATG
jgi:hypothetical protein